MTIASVARRFSKERKLRFVSLTCTPYADARTLSEGIRHIPAASTNVLHKNSSLVMNECHPSEKNSLSSNKIVKSSVTNSTVSANLKGSVNYYYTQGICVLNFEIVDSSGNRIADIDSLRTSKEGGSYSSTITLEISSV